MSAFGASAHASDADFKLVNETGFRIDEVYVSNIIPQQVLRVR
jgi:hypothetical protein